VTCLGIFVAIFFYCRRPSRVRGVPGSSTVNAVSHSGSRDMGGMQVSSVGSSGSIGGLQAASIVSPINARSQEPLPSASAVHSPSQPHMAEDRQPVPDNVTNPTSLKAGSLPTPTTIDIPNITTTASESSRGAPVVPSVPSQLPSSFYRENAKASANMETWRQGEYHGLPMV